MWGPILAWFRKQIGQRTDTASATGSVHAKLGELRSRMLMAVASDTLQQSANTERTVNSITYTLKKSITCNVDGTLRVSFDLKSYSGNVTAYGRIYKNGVALGTERSTGTGSYVTFSEDLSFVKTDLIQLYIKGSNTDSAYCRNFRVYFDQTAAAPIVVTD